MSGKLILGVLSLTVALLAVPTAGLLALQQPAPINPTSSSPPIAMDQIDRWIAMTGQFDNRLLYTVYGCLTVLVTVLIALVGYNWFSNNRSYERDKASMLASLAGELKQEIASFKQEQLSRLDSQLGEIRQIVSDSETKLEKRIAEKTAGTKRDLDTSIQIVRDDIRYIQMAQQEAESEMWEAKGVQTNAIGCQVAVGRLAMDLKYDTKLDRVFENVERLLKVSKRAGSWESDLLDFLEKAPSKFDSFKTRIRGILDAGK